MHTRSMELSSMFAKRWAHIRNSRKMLLLAFLVFSAAIAIWFVLLNEADRGKQVPHAEQGVLDLRGWSFAEQGIVALNGKWRYYPEQFAAPGIGASSSSAVGSPAGSTPPELVTVPSSWWPWNEESTPIMFGYGTFRLEVLLPPGEPMLGLQVANIKTAHRLYVNGLEIGHSGDPGTDASDTVAENVPYARYFIPQGERLDIVIQIANFDYYYGGITHPVVLGLQEQIMNKREQALALDTIEWGGILVLGIYFLSLYRMRPTERAWLYFGLFGLVGSVYVLGQGEKILGLIMPGMNYAVFTKIQFCSGPIATYFLVRYIQVSYPAIFWAPFRRAVQVATILWTAVVLLTPPHLFTRLEFMYVLSFIILLYLLYVMVIGALRGTESSVYMILAAISVLGIMFVVFANNIGYSVTKLLIAIFILIFLFSQVMLMSRRFTKAFATVESLSERLLSMDKLKDEFLAATSHEMRTPLHGVINIAQSLLEGAAGALTPQQRSNMSLIVTTGKRLAHLLNDILDLSKLERGDVRLTRKPVELSPIVQVIFEVLHGLADNKSIRLVNEVDESSPAVYADEDRLSQMLYNLIGNAIKFTDQGHITVASERQAGWLLVSVSDTGIGVAPELRKSIFEAYEQGGGVIAEKYGGTGLGLSITKRLVELHGGTIAVESRPGGGAVFLFTLPIIEVESLQTANAAEAIAEPLAEGRRSPVLERADEVAVLPERMELYQPGETTILVVDDDAANRQVLMNLLSVEKYSVIAVGSGRDALRELERGPRPDLVIVDLMMPGMNGYDLTRAFRERFSLSDLPIVMLTARSWEADMLAGFAAGVNDFLGKPVDASELRARIRTLLDMKRSATDKIRMEMAFLQAQIKPHFLFNTLNTIMAVSHSDVAKAQELLGELSEYLRRSFDFHNQERFVPLERELELVDSYVFIEQARFGDRLRFIRDVDEQLEYWIPPLTVQPIVENAVRHGVTKNPDGGTVVLSVREEGRELIIEVLDDGPGVPEVLHNRLTAGRATGGVGLINIERRLRTTYGTGMEIGNGLQGGVSVRIRIPAQQGNGVLPRQGKSG